MAGVRQAGGSAAHQHARRRRGQPAVGHLHGSADVRPAGENLRQRSAHDDCYQRNRQAGDG